jgi:hypothetical protein
VPQEYWLMDGLTLHHPKKSMECCMTKKSKRQIRRVVNPDTEKSMPDALVGNRPTGFNPDYHWVIKDIRRVGILAGSFIVVLVTLAFFLH